MTPLTAVDYWPVSLSVCVNLACDHRRNGIIASMCLSVNKTVCQFPLFLTFHNEIRHLTITSVSFVSNVVNMLAVNLFVLQLCRLHYVFVRNTMQRQAR